MPKIAHGPKIDANAWHDVLYAKFCKNLDHMNDVSWEHDAALRTVGNIGYCILARHMAHILDQPDHAVLT